MATTATTTEAKQTTETCDLCPGCSRDMTSLEVLEVAVIVPARPDLEQPDSPAPATATATAGAVATLPPDPDDQNDDRADWAMTAVEAFAKETGLNIEHDGLDTAICDLLADLGHLCDRRGLELGELFARAASHYTEETERGGAQFKEVTL